MKLTDFKQGMKVEFIADHITKKGTVITLGEYDSKRRLFDIMGDNSNYFGTCCVDYVKIIKVTIKDLIGD